MTTPSDAHLLWDFMAALAISVVSGAVSIARRIAAGHPANVLWIASEFLTAILCGYLMYDAYPALSGWLPDWISRPVAVAFVAHSGGRLFQELESTILRHYSILLNRSEK